MNCPNCGKDNNIVFSSEHKQYIPIRVRFCKVCGERFKTREAYIPRKYIGNSNSEKIKETRNTYILYTLINYTKGENPYELQKSNNDGR